MMSCLRGSALVFPSILMMSCASGDDDLASESATPSDDVGTMPEPEPEESASDDDIQSSPEPAINPGVDNVEQPATTSAEPIALEDFREAMIAASCELTMTCRYGRDLDVRLLFETEQRCREHLDRLSGPDLQAMIDAAASEVLSYDADEAGRCVALLPRSCGLFEPEEPFNAFYSICAEVFDGTAPLGARCKTHEECAGDAYCTDRFSDCGGMCAARPAVGESCAEGGYCSNVAGELGALCGSDGICASVERGSAGLGERCARVETGAGQVVITQCEGSLECGFLASGEPPTCHEPVAVGGACADEGTICVDGAYCSESAGACWGLEFARAAGEPCDPATWPENGYVFCDPAANLRCGDSGQCELISDGAAGQPCQAGVLDGCAPGLRCMRAEEPDVAGTCLPRAELGEPCVFDEHCNSGACRAPEGSSAKVCVSRYCGD